MRELVGRRSANSSVFALADGRLQAEVSSSPVHYRDAAGVWRDIDATVRPASPAERAAGFVAANRTNQFSSEFAGRSDRLARFELGGRRLTVGVDAPGRAVSPVVSGDTVTFGGVAGGADVSYTVTPDALKERIVLSGRPSSEPVYRFTVDLSGLSARPRGDGSIAFLPADGADDRPLLLMPAPFMTDSTVDDRSPFGSGFSDKVTQSVEQHGSRLTVTVRADAEWLANRDRKYPVVIDPTIRVEPTPTQAQDVMILKDSPGINFEGSPRLDVGTTSTGPARSLVKFPLPPSSELPAGTPLDSADLMVYYDQNFGVDGSQTIQAHPATAAWTASTATWNNANGIVGPLDSTEVTVDDGDAGTSTATLNQTSGGTNVGVWGNLGSFPFVAGTTSKVTVHDSSDPTKATVVDAIRWTKDSSVTRPSGQSNVWHTFPVRNIVQPWVNGTTPNNGFVLTDADESTLNRGGPRYEASEFAYNGEIANRPKLVLTWGRPSVDVAPPTVIHATGAELHWPAYVDPSSSTADDAVEYQVHRSVFQTFAPQASTLIAPLSTTALSYTDTTATPTPADSPQPFGDAFYYMVAVKTRDGQVIPGPTQEVRLPKAGRVTRLIQDNVTDTTLSSALPDANENALTGQPWLMVGDNSGTFGRTRAVVKFPGLSAIPPTARVLDAQVHLWGFTNIPGTGTGGVYELHGLTRDFDQTTATWNKANSTTTWTTAGGDFSTTVSGSVTGVTNDPKRYDWDATTLTQGWVTTPTSNHGVELKLANETTPAERTIFLSSEAAEPELHPYLAVTYTEKTTEDTYYAPFTPARMIRGDTQTVAVTLTNTTAATWSATTRKLTYHWTLPDGTDVTNGGNQVQTVLPKDLVPGDTVTVNATLKAPIQSGSGNKREAYVLTWDLLNTTTGTFLSTSDGIPGLAQDVSVEDPTSDQLGLEKFYQYAGLPTGAGGSLMDNLFAGNLVWGYNAFSNPSRGVASFVRLTYNSQDTSASSMGFGWSLSTSSVTRLGSPLDFHPPGQSWPTDITLTDGDGTAHAFTLNKHGSTNEALWDYDHPAGVHLYLQKTGSSDTARAWKMTAPDHTVFYFDSDGYQSAVADDNGNELLFTYESRRSNNKPIKFLKYLTDPAGRQTLTLSYYGKGENYTFFDDTGTEVSASNLTNPFIIDQVRSVTDISGRTLTLTYTDKGLMARMVDAAGSPLAKTFRFGYDATQGNKNVKLVSVTDPRGHSTALSYYSLPTDDPAFHWWFKNAGDRLANPTTVTYADPDGTAGSTIQTLVTDAENHDSTYTMDGFGRPSRMVNALGQTTQLHFDADNNVDRLQEDNGAATTWVHDPVTGLPQSMADAQANNDGTAASTYGYQTFDNGHTADLTRVTSPEGRASTFGYDTQHNLLSVTDPAGNATPTAGDFTTTYTYDGFGQLATAKDANGNTTRYTAYDANGYPQTITDPLNNPTSFVYDVRGQVTKVTDALGHFTTQNYDVFGRPTDSTAPKDQAAGVLITTPPPVYDPNDNVTQATAPNGAVTTAVYDDNDRVTSVSAPKDTPTGPARTATYTYDRVGNVLTQTEPDGTLTTTDPNDFTTHYAYDPIYQLSTVTNAIGDRAGYTYDDVGNVTTVVDPRKNATADTTDFTTRYTHDLDHRIKTATDAAGNVKITDYDGDGNTVATTDEDGNKTLLTLDARGMVAQVQRPFKNNSGTIVYNTTRYTYDQVGNQTRVETPRGVATTAVTTDFTAETTYDELNRVKDKLTPFDPNDPRYNTPDRTTYTYDTVGRLATVSAPPSAGQTVRNNTTYSYFDNGWPKSTTDPWDIATTYDYNVLGQQTTRTITSAGGSSSRTMTWDYYPDGKLKSTSDDGVPVGAQVVLVDNSDAQSVSAVGSWPSSTSPTGFQGFDYQTHAAGTGTNTFAWNLTIPQDGTYQVFVKYPAASATNAPYTVTTAGGASTTKAVNQQTGAGTWVSLGSFAFTADGAGQKVSLSDSANGTVAADAVKLVRDNSADADNEKTTFGYTYDPNGNQTQITDGSPNALIDTYAVTYNGLDQVSKAEEKLAGVVKHTTMFTYNENGTPLTRQHDTEGTTFAYDVRDLLASVTNTESASDPKPKVSTFTYTKRGETLHETHGNGNTVDYTYFLDGALQHQIERKSDGTTVVAEHTHDYDPNGNQTTDVSKVQNADNHAAYIDRTTTDTYDPRDRLASVTKKDGSGATVSSESYVYDANGNTVSETAAGSTITSVYDRNRLQTTVTDGVASSYNYDPFGRLDTVTTAGVQIDKYTYDGFDHIATERRNNGTGSTTTRYTYDPFDRTVSQTTNAGATGEKTTLFHYLALSGQLIAEEAGGRTTKTYQYSPWSQRLSQVVHNTDGTEDSTYYAYNARSDVEAVTDDNGDAKATYGYTAYGSDDTSQFTGLDTPDSQNPGAEPYNSYRYNAARLDSTTGTYDMGFRDYSPGLNRFLTRDLYTGALDDMGLDSDPFTGNRYAFGGGNPLSNIELDGHCFLSLCEAVDAVGDAFDTAADFLGDHVDDIVSIGAGYLAGTACEALLGPETGGLATPACVAVGGAVTNMVDYGLNTPLDQQTFGGYLGSAGEGAAISLATLGAGRLLGKGASKVASKAGGALAAATGKIGVAGAKVAVTAGKLQGAARRVTSSRAVTAARSKASNLARKAGCTNSFPAGTPVLMGNGTTKPIQQIQTGDWVEATDPHTGTTIAEPVLATIVTPDDQDFTDTTITTASGTRTTITSTQHHPFYDITRHQWVNATDLTPGDQLRQPDGTTVTVLTTRNHHHRQTAYNLTVDGIHTYYVIAGNTPVLVHNCNDGGFKNPVSPDEISEINQGHGGATLLHGSPENAVANASRYGSFWEKSAVMIRDIAEVTCTTMEISGPPTSWSPC